MDDIVEKDRTKLTVVNYEAVAIIKQNLRKMKIKSTELTIEPKMKKACIKAYETYQLYLKQKKEEEMKRQEERLSASVQILKAEKAKRISKLVKLKNRLMAKSNKPLKRRAEDSLTSQRKKQWKRIKVVI